MNRILFLDTGGVILRREDAVEISRAIFRAQDILARHGQRFTPRMLALATGLASTAGTAEVHSYPIEQTVEHEQIDTATAAKLLGCSPRNVRGLASSGRLPGVKRGTQWQFNREDVESIVDGR